MNREQIIEIAKQAGLQLSVYAEAYPSVLQQLERFAKLVEEVEREKCANVCELRSGTVSMFANSREAITHNRAVNGDAAAIRARSLHP